jgi:acyl-CoA synthetase (NDP forming)
MLEGVELIAGVVRDALFGPLVALGLGGIFAELVNTAAIAIAPLTDVDAEEIVAAGPIARLAAGFRGRPPLDVSAIESLLHRLSALALDVPEIAELDLNPVLATSSGCVAIDRRIRVTRHRPAGRVKSW